MPRSDPNQAIKAGPLSNSPSAFRLRNSPSRTGLKMEETKKKVFNLPIEVAQVIPKLYKDTKGYGT
jgi:hypothetical protein